MPRPASEDMDLMRPSRRDFIAQLASGLIITPLVGATAFAMRESVDTPISLLEALTDRERADVLAATNRVDLTVKIRDLIASAPAGSIIDATMLRGVVNLSGNIFEGIPDAPVTLRTGNVAFVKDFNRGPLTLPSRIHWQGQGTVIRPAAPIRAIPSDNAVAFAMVETHVIPGHCNGTRGEARIEALNAAYTSGLKPGARIAIFGIHPDLDIRHSIHGALTARTASFTFNESAEHTLEGSLAYLLVDDEIMLGLQQRGAFNTAAGGGRGMLGTAARPHADAAAATVLRSEIFTVTGVSGTTVMLDRPLPRTFVNAQFRAGSVGSRMSGAFVIDGAFDRDHPGALFYCLATTLGSDFRAEGDIALRRGMHGGFIGYGCQGATLDIAEVSGCGRPRQALGASLWLFGSAVRNQIRVRRVTDGYCGYIIDNKSNGVSYYGLDGPCLANSIQIDLLERHVAEGEISGSSGNTVLLGDSDTSAQSTIIDHGTSQATTPIPTSDNVVTVLRQRRRWSPAGDALQGNRVVVNGNVEH